MEGHERLVTEHNQLFSQSWFAEVVSCSEVYIIFTKSVYLCTLVEFYLAFS